MRFVVKKERDKTAKLASQETLDILQDIAENKNKSRISDTIYRDSYNTPDGKGSHVEDQLALSYLNKCGYCERICKADIEHYRPKKKVDGITNHDGYYWLCYEWTNLLPSCVTCNREGAKHTKFSVLGTRVMEPTFQTNGKLNLNANKASNNPLLAETPGLLHPEVDHPEEYFIFEVRNPSDGIRLKAKSNTLSNPNVEERANETIKICKLNRQELRLDRMNLINDFLTSVESAFGSNDGADLVDEISKLLKALELKSTKENLTHTLLRKYIVEDKNNFTSVVLPFCDNNREKRILEVAFESVLDG